jgi:hypothetical protein
MEQHSNQHDTETRDSVIAVGLMALGLHQANHALPAPLAIDLPSPGEPAYIRVRVAGVADQLRWLNTVHLDDQDETPALLDHTVRIVWHVRLPETGTKIELVGLRDVRTAVPA